MSLCTQSSWYAVNGKYKAWYLETYPWLLEFPPSMTDLRDFYVDDMRFRNLTPLDTYKNCYEFLLSYALENMPRVADESRFTGQTWVQRLIKDQWRNESTLWTALKTTGSQITQTLSWMLPVAIIGLIIWASKE